MPQAPSSGEGPAPSAAPPWQAPPEPAGAFAGERGRGAGPVPPSEPGAPEPPDPGGATAASSPPGVEASPAYAENPAPVYPRIARRRGLEGEVWLRVRVSPEGGVFSVEVERSSGHPVLDGAAVEAVRKWRFHPARAGEVPVEGVVRVPIRFELLPSG